MAEIKEAKIEVLEFILEVIPVTVTNHQDEFLYGKSIEKLWAAEISWLADIATTGTVTQLSDLSANMGVLTAGTIILPSGGYIRSGQTAYNTGTGFYLWNDVGTPKFSIWNSAGFKFLWDGTNVSINGIITTGVWSSVDWAYLTAASVTGTSIANATIQSVNIASATITGSNISAATISGSNIVAATITGSNISAATITGGNITAATITGSNLVNATVTGTQIGASTITAANITAATITGTEIASSTIVAGNIASSTITASQIANNTITAGNIASGTITSNEISGSAGITGGQIASASIVGGNIASTTITAANITNLTITAAQIANLTLTSSKVQTGLMSYSHDLVFSVSSSTVVAWTSGTITTSDGTSYSIVSGNTGTMSAQTYIYLDIAVSSTVLQVTTTMPTAVWDGKMLLATAKNNTTEAIFQVFNGIGGVNLAGSNIVAESITANEIAAATITAAKIVANTITANEIAAATITGAKISAATTITAGTGTDVWVVDWADATWRIYAGHSTPASAPFRVDKAWNVTMTSATINGYTTTNKGTFWGNKSDWVVTDSALTITGSNNTVIIKNYSSWTAGSVARSFTVTPTGCILLIKINWSADFTNWTFNFNGKGALGGADEVTGSATLFGNTWGVGNDGSGGQWGGGWASSTTSGTVGGGGGWAGWITIGYNNALLSLLKQYKIDCGSGGGGGESTLSYGWAGGNWGGCVIFEITGNVELWSATFNYNWNDGAVGDPLNTSWGGGGGGGGSLLMLYNGTKTGTSTNNSSGWAGGVGATNNGGAGWTGTIVIQENTVFS